MTHPLDFPFDCHKILRKKQSIKRDLEKQPGLIKKRIAILGGSTTSEVKLLIEIFLLKEGIQSIFYESEYNKYAEDILFENPKLEKFKPEIIYIHTSIINITSFPTIGETEEGIQDRIEKEFSNWEELWRQISTKYKCPIIQNNFELPDNRVLGNLDFSDIHGRTNFILKLNCLLSEYARNNKNFHINDIFYLSSSIGLGRWYDKTLWFTSKYAMSYASLPLLAYNISNIIKALLGNSQKCLVLDLDNTIWGGIIGEQGLNGIEIGNETPIGEAFIDFQKYVKDLKNRGIILAICSKNDLEVAQNGFKHPDSILKLEDITVFKANWEPKHENIKAIAKEINIDLGSLVFLDDSPVEREIVTAHVPTVKVPNFGNDITRYIDILDQSGYFETISISPEDLERNRTYTENILRQDLVARFENYEEFLRSLEMNAEIKPFTPIYFDRITQLINKTNQFNLTAKRFTFPEVENISIKSDFITLYGRLKDKFGDNGLISVIIGEIYKEDILITLWLMSCRILKRGMEQAMFDKLVNMAKQRGIKNIKGVYLKSPKNSIVENFYLELGFEKITSNDNGDSEWAFKIPTPYKTKNKWINTSL
jgi:FkbH-like protein